MGLLVGFGIGWVLIGPLLFIGLRHLFMRNTAMFTRLKFSFVSSIFLGPAFALGHGGAALCPAPGLAVIQMAVSGNYSMENMALNLALWAVTLLFFIAVDSQLAESEETID